MAATYVSTTTVGQIRELIYDTDLTAPLFQDEALTNYYTHGGSNLFKAAGLALLSLAARLSAKPKDFKSASFEKQFQEVASVRMLATQYLDLAKEQTHNKPGYANAEIAHTPENAARIIANRAAREGL